MASDFAPTIYSPKLVKKAYKRTVVPVRKPAKPPAKKGKRTAR